MMNIYTDAFKERTLVRRVFLPSDVSKECLKVLAGLLNEYPSVHTKSPFSLLAGATVSFSAYHFADGYVLEGKMTQTQTDALGYFFVNPYKEAESALNQIFEKGYVYSEKNLAVVKEKTLMENEILCRSSSVVSDAVNGVMYSDIIIDEKKIMSIRKEDVDSLLSLVRKNDIGDTIYFGKKCKNEVYFPISCKNALPEAFSVKHEDEIVTKYLDDETLSFVIETKKMEKISEYYLLKAALSYLKSSLETELKKRLSLDLDISVSMVDCKHHLLKITVPHSKAQAVRDVISIQDGKMKISIAKDEDVVRKVVDEDSIMENMDSARYLEDRMRFSDLRLDEDDILIDDGKMESLLTSFVISDERILGKDKK